jgi:hypothetical protein
LQRVTLPEDGAPLNDSFVSDAYVGFVDLLGFSAMVLKDFSQARQVYGAILNANRLLPGPGVRTRPWGVDVTAASDTFLVSGKRLQEVANWCSGIQVSAAREGMLVRGSIAYGRHARRDIHDTGGSRHHTLLVSEPLVWAADDEHHRVIPPCGITLHGSVSPEEIAELDSAPQKAKQRSIVFKDGRWITNPFGADVIHWIEPKLKEMVESHRTTKHGPKYQWFLDLFKDVVADKPLRPPE